MPSVNNMRTTTAAMPTSTTERSHPPPPTLPLARPVKRGGSNDLEGERPAWMRTPSPQSSMPPRPSSPELSQHPQDERVPDGYVRRQVAEKEIFQLWQQFLAESYAFNQKHDEMMRTASHTSNNTLCSPNGL